VAEIAMLSVFRDYPDGKVVYIAPLKALVSERISDWKVRIESKLGKKVVELTGDVAPDVGAIQVGLHSIRDLFCSLYRQTMFKDGVSSHLRLNYLIVVT